MHQLRQPCAWGGYNRCSSTRGCELCLAERPYDKLLWDLDPRELHLNPGESIIHLVGGNGKLHLTFDRANAGGDVERRLHQRHRHVVGRLHIRRAAAARPAHRLGHHPPPASRAPVCDSRPAEDSWRRVSPLSLLHKMACLSSFLQTSLPFGAPDSSVDCFAIAAPDRQGPQLLSGKASGAMMHSGSALPFYALCPARCVQ